MSKIFPVFIIFILLFFGCGRQEGIGISSFISPSAFKLSLADGVDIYIDVITPGNIDEDAGIEDFLLITHGHSDHYNPAVTDAFPGTVVLFDAFDLELESSRISMIPAAHNADDEITEHDATNYLVVIESCGLVVVHMGDIGQNELTASQLERIRDADLAFMKIDNSISLTSMEEKTGFKLLRQFTPKIFVVTHSTEPSLNYAFDTYRGFYPNEKRDYFFLTKPIVPDKGLNILAMGTQVLIYKERNELTGL